MAASSEAANESGLYPRLNQGLGLFQAGQYFEAHEIWEAIWLEEVGRTKLTLKALIQLSAALDKHREGRPAGTSKLLAKALETLGEVRTGCSSWLGLDLVALSEETGEALRRADAIAAGEAPPESLIAPRLPRRTGPDGVLYLHGFASGPSSRKGGSLVEDLRQLGLHVDFPDQNEDDFSHFTIRRGLSLARRFLRDRTLIVGSSLGAYIGALLASRDERVKGLVLMAPAFEFGKRMTERFGEAALAAWREAGQIEVEHYSYGKKLPIGFSLYEDACSWEGVPRLSVPTAILYGIRDELVPRATVERAAQGNAMVVELEAVDDEHSLGGSLEAARSMTLRMVKRLGLQPEPPDDLTLGNSPG